ncbi:MAG: hypothetical protein FWH01_05520 [Oscillospiraceae bacterium]|nr:hypothetical protein [Oscillospiraceae bacterium]
MAGLLKIAWNWVGAAFYRGKWRSEEGMGTVEIVIIIAVLVGLALIFRDAILGFATGVMEGLFANDQISNDVDVSNIRGDYGIG